MAGRGPTPKDPSVRQRRNKVSTARHLSAVHDVKAPSLPVKRPAWLKATRDWWASIWAAPMAPEFDPSDVPRLVMLAYVVEDFHRAESAKERREALVEIRQQSICFGLTPIDRRRLQWEIDRGEGAEQQTRKRREASKPKAAGKGATDPRQALVS